MLTNRLDFDPVEWSGTGNPPELENRSRSLPARSGDRGSLKEQDEHWLGAQMLHSVPIERPPRKAWNAFLLGQMKFINRVRTRWGRKVWAFSRRSSRLPTEISKSQRRVVELMGNGLSNKEIGAELGLSESTVGSHVSALVKKLGAKCRLELELWIHSGREQVSSSRSGLRCCAFALDCCELFCFEIDDPLVDASHRSCAQGHNQLALPFFEQPSSSSRMTKVELEIFTLLLDGTAAREIASIRGVSHRTIANQLAGIYRKFEVNSVHELVTKIQGPAGLYSH